MNAEITTEEIDLFNDIARHAAGLWEKCKGVEGLNTDPKMFSIMLLKRLWSNHQGFTTLWLADHYLECAIILRSAVEAAICLAANRALGEKFVELMRGDAIATQKGQIKIYREIADAEMVGQSEAVLRDLCKGFPPEAKPAKLDWADLAKQGGVPDLYNWHRQLSGLWSHVTGVSILNAVEPMDGTDPASELAAMQPHMHLMMMAGATLIGCRHYTQSLNDDEGHANTVSLLTRLAPVSDKWQ